MRMRGARHSGVLIAPIDRKAAIGEWRGIRMDGSGVIEFRELVNYEQIKVAALRQTHPATIYFE